MIWNKRSRGEYLGYIHTKIALIVWAILYIIYPPRVIIDKIGFWLILASGTLTILGSIIGIVGLNFSNSKDLIKKYRGFIIESSGLIIALVGPLSFFITALYMTIILSEPQLVSLSALSYALFASLLGRLTMIRQMYNNKTVVP